MALALIAACSPHSGMAPPQLLTGAEIAALGAQAAAGGPSGGADMAAMADGLTHAAPAAAGPGAGNADLGPRGEALRARAAALRERDGAQAAESDALRRRAEALRQVSKAGAADAEAPDDEEEEEKERRRHD